MKFSRRQMIVTSIVVLLPILAGLLLWNTLPEELATHWGADGMADGFSNKGFAVLGLPLFLLATHWLCAWITSKDPKYSLQHPFLLHLMLWICPVISLLGCGMTYAVALGSAFNPVMLISPVLGLLFLLIGNYMPKCRPNYTIGFKVAWTLASEENWNATHRLGGHVWVAGSLLLIACTFLPPSVSVWIWIVAIAAMILIPTIYSYLYYQKQYRAGTVPKKPVVPIDRWVWVLTSVLVALAIIVAIVLVFICFTGNITVRYDNASFTIEASYWKDLTVAYDAVDAIEFHESLDPGARRNGFGTPRLSMGTFQNEAFNYYTRYAYTDCEACVVLTVSGKTLAIGGADAAATEAIYQELLKHIE